MNFLPGPIRKLVKAQIGKLQKHLSSIWQGILESIAPQNVIKVLGIKLQEVFLFIVEKLGNMSKVYIHIYVMQNTYTKTV